MRSSSRAAVNFRAGFLVWLPLLASACQPTAADTGRGAATPGQPAANATASSREIYLLAHGDDGDLFVNPDLEAAIAVGASVQTIFITAGDGGRPSSYWLSREDGVRAGQAAMAGVANAWTCGAKAFAPNKTGQLCTLNARPQVSVIFLRLPEGQLPALWQKPGPFVTTVSSLTTLDGVSVYTRADLVQTLANIISQFAPTKTGMLDSSQVFGPQGNTYDEEDHLSAGFFALEADHGYASAHDVRMYRGYNTYIDPASGWIGSPPPENPNLSTADHDEKVRIYNINTALSGGGAVQPNDSYDRWCWRKYSFFKVPSGVGPLQGQGNACLDVAGGSSANGTAAVLSPCTGALSQQWTVTAGSLVQGIASKCLGIASDGVSAQISDCVGAAQQQWSLMDNGQLKGWQGACLTVPAGGGPLQAASCDNNTSATPWTAAKYQQWSLGSVAPPVTPTISARSKVTAFATGLTASVTARPGMTYSWSIAGGTLTSAASGATSNGTNSVTYTAGAVGNLVLSCVETNAASTSSSPGTFTVSVVAPPVQPAISAAGPVTAGAAGLTASVAANPGSTYAWTISGGTITSAGGSSGVTAGATNTLTYTAGSGASVSFTCVETNAAGTAGSPGSASVAVVPAPIAPAINAPPAVTTLATGAAASVSVRSGMTYRWTISGGTLTSAGGASGVTSGTTNSITFSAGPVGTLSLSCTETNAAGAGASGAANVSVVSAPVAPAISAPAAVTAAATGTASVPARAGMTYQWTLSNGTISSAGGSAGVTSGGTNSIAFTSSTLGALNLTAAEVNAAGDRASSTAAVQIVAPADATITAPSLVAANATGLQASVPAGQASYAWTIAGGVITGGASTAAVTFTAGTGTSLTLSCAVRNAAGDPVSSSRSVQVVPTNSTIVTASPVTAGKAGLTASVPGGQRSYSWGITGGTITSGTTASSITYTAGSGATPVALSCTAVDNTGASSSGTSTVQVVQPANATITASSPVQAFQTGLTASVPAGQSGYAWTLSGGTITAGSSTNQVTYTAGSGASPVTLTANVTNAAGDATTGTTTVTVISTPVVPTISAASPATTGATGLTASVTARQGMTYRWTISGGTITGAGGAAGTTAGGTNTLTYSAGAPGTLTLTCVEVTATGATSSPGTANVSVVAAPATPVISTPGVAVTNATGLVATVVANPGMTYSWTISGGTLTSSASGTTSGGANSITFSAGAPGTLTLGCTEINAAGTSGSPGSRAVSVQPAAAASRDLYLVAHQDDDLLFMNPDIETSILAGHTVRTVYETAGDAGNPASYWLAREDGVRAAYSTMAGVANTWQCATKKYLVTKSTVLCTLAAQPQISLLFMRIYSENQAGLSATSPSGLLPLWNRPGPYLISVNSVNTTDGTTTYTRADLINTLAAIMNDFSPTRIGTLDDTQIYGPANNPYDHDDHISSAFFAFEAAHAYGQPHDLRLYRGYNTYIDPNGGWTGSPPPESPNLSQAEHDEKVRVFNAYSLAWGGGPLQPNDSYDRWSWRRFGFLRLTRGSGAFVEPGGNCLDTGGSTATGAPAQISACLGGSQQQWTLTSNEQLVGPAGKCLTLASDGISVILSDCVGAAQQKWTSFSNGQLRGWEGGCLSVPTGSTQLQMLDCDSDRSSALPGWIAPAYQRWVQQLSKSRTWSVGQQFSDADLGTTTSYYRTFQLADVNGDGTADACVRRADGVYCALNNSSGSFASYALYSSAFADAAGFGVDATGTTLRMGDVNADGRADACARSSAGIVCATANAAGTAFVNARVWSSGNDFSDAAGWAASPSYYQSIRLADVNGDGYADVCGRLAGGIYCALNNRNGGFSPATLWLADFTDASGWSTASYGTTLQFADINGDGKADVCGRGAAGIRCAVANSAGTGFINARIWSWRNDFSDAASWNTALSYYGSIRLTDVNGDGLADVCGRGPNGIVCALNNGLAFDHTTPVLPVSFTDALGWLPDRYGSTISFGDLANRGRADVCGRSASDLQCSLSP